MSASSRESARPLPHVAGVGLLTPLGDAEETWRGLLQGRCIETHGRIPADVLARYPDQSQSHLVKLAVAAARMACGKAVEELDGPDTALVVGTSKGPMESWITRAIAFDPIGEGEAPAEPGTAWNSRLAGRLALPTPGKRNRPGIPPLPYMEPVPYVIGGLEISGVARLASEIARGMGICGPALTYCGACASGLHALIRGCMMVRHGEAKRVLVVAAESALHPLFLASYQRLGVLAGPEGCRPFDQRRTGFLPSEAAAAVLLAGQPARIWPSEGQAPIRIDSMAMSADAAHLTASEPSGRTFRRLIQTLLGEDGCDLYHAHGTGTPMNDQIELSAIESCIRPSQPRPRPILYSHKAALGHTLGASGLISVVLNCLAHRDGAVPGNIRTTRPMPTAHVSLSDRPVLHPIRRSVALAAGFGGAQAGVSLLSQAS